MAHGNFKGRAYPGHTVCAFVPDIQDLQRFDWWRGQRKLDHLAFDKNWKVPLVAGSSCELNGNEKNAVASARRIISDGIYLVLARSEPLGRKRIIQVSKGKPRPS